MALAIGSSGTTSQAAVVISGGATTVTWEQSNTAVPGGTGVSSLREIGSPVTTTSGTLTRVNLTVGITAIDLSPALTDLSILLVSSDNQHLSFGLSAIGFLSEESVYVTALGGASMSATVVNNTVNQAAPPPNNVAVSPWNSLTSSVAGAVTLPEPFFGGHETLTGTLAFSSIALNQAVTAGQQWKAYLFSSYGDPATGTAFSLSSVSIEMVGLTAVPEPGETALLAGLGLIGFACWRRRVGQVR
jgi:hypothetical protein